MRCSEARAVGLRGVLLGLWHAHVGWLVSPEKSDPHEWTPDLLLSDINMPEEDGYSFIGKIRKEGRTFPAVAVTAYGQWEDRAKTLSSGFQTHVAKPVEPKELIAIVASLTGRMSMM